MELTPTPIPARTPTLIAVDCLSATGNAVPVGITSATVDAVILAPGVSVADAIAVVAVVFVVVVEVVIEAIAVVMVVVASVVDPVRDLVVIAVAAFRIDADAVLTEELFGVDDGSGAVLELTKDLVMLK
ncbi:hypothetical protein MBLNU459_g5269t1 [Dothideomycetes sp. NU459]